MLRRIHQKLGTAGFIISIVALIAAIGGTALAAGGLTKSQEKQVKKIAKKYAGKPGAPGPAGPAGTNGTNGKDGASGAAGKDGTSVTTSAASNVECPTVGGVKITSASGNAKVCNGQTGFTETLPSGKTETGQWAVSAKATAANQKLTSAISFTIPVTPPAGEFKAHYITVGGSLPTGCTGSVEAPGAEPGNLCVFAQNEENAAEWKLVPFPGVEIPIRFLSGQSNASEEASSTGAVLLVGSAASGEVEARGSWAVTAE